MQRKFTSIFVLLAAMFVNISAFAQGGVIGYSVSTSSNNSKKITNLNDLSPDKYYALKNGGSNSYLGYGKDSPTVLSNLDYSCVVQLIKSDDTDGNGNNLYKIRHVGTDTYYQGFSKVEDNLTLDKEKVEYTITTGFTLFSPRDNKDRTTNISNDNFFFINGDCLLHQDNNNPVLAADPFFDGIYSQWSIWEVDFEGGTERKYSPLAYPKQITSVDEFLTSETNDDYYILKNYGGSKNLGNDYYLYGKSPEGEERPLRFKDTPDYSCIVRFIYNEDDQTLHIQQVSTGLYFQPLELSKATQLGTTPANYTFTTGADINGHFRLATVGGNSYLSIDTPQGETEANVRGHNGTGDYTLWDIYKVSNTLPLNGDDDITEEDGITAETIKFNHDGTYNINLSRKIKEGFNTVVLPFDLTADKVEELFGEGYVVYDFSDRYDIDNNTVFITFNTRTSGDIEANTPVLVKATRASESNENASESNENASNSNTIKDVTIKSSDEPIKEGNYFDFTGVYSPQVVPVGSYFLSGSTLYQRKEETITNIKPFRAYLYDKGNNISTVRLNIGDLVTGIDRIDAAKAESDIIYNLFGQRVTKMEKGIYIVNGKKIIVE